MHESAMTCAVLSLAALLVPSQDSGPLPAALAERMEALASDAVHDGQLDGLTLVARFGDETIFEGAWGDGPARGGPARIESEYPLGALLERFVAVAALECIDRDEMRSGATVADVIDDLSDSPVASITTDQLFLHASGLPPLEDLVADPQAEALRASLSDALETAVLSSDPGTCSSYSEVNDLLLAWMLESASERPLTDVLAAGGLAGLLQTGAGSSTPNVRATASDLLDWNAQLEGGELLSARSHKLLTSRPEIDGAPISHAYGARWSQLDDFTLRTAGGSSHDASVALVYVPEAELSIVALSSTEDASLSDFVRRAARAVLDLPAPAGEAVPLPPEAGERFVGSYQTGCDRWTISYEDERLILESGYRNQVRFYYRGGNVFAAESDEETALLFIMQGDRVVAFELDDRGIVTRGERS